MENKGNTAVKKPIKQPRTENRENSVNAINVIERHSEKSIAKASNLGPAGRKVVKRGSFLVRVIKKLQHKKDFLKTTPRRLMLGTFIIASFIYGGLLYAFPSLQNLCKYVDGFGKYSKWVYWLGILLPMAGSTTLIAEFCILSDEYPSNSDFDFNDRFGKILLKYFDPRHHESTSAFPQHGYTVIEIHAHISSHLGIYMPSDLTVKSLDDYLISKLKVDRVNKRKKGIDKQFFLAKKLCPKTCLVCSVELVNEPSNPNNHDS